MNAQVAYALDRSGALAPNSHVNGIPELESFDLAADPALQALWVRRTSTSCASVTLSQLRENHVLDEFLLKESGRPFRFKILCSGQPGVFSLGGDLNLFANCIELQDRKLLQTYAHLAISAIWSNVSAYGARRTRSIALIEGEAQGGGFEAALSCNTIVAERGSSFGFPEVLFGLFPGMGGELLLSTRVSANIAEKMVVAGNRFSAEFLHEIGVVDYIVEPGTGPSFVNRLMARASGTSTSFERDEFERRQERLNTIRWEHLEESVARWVAQALSLDARRLRNMRYIVEMQNRRVA